MGEAGAGQAVSLDSVLAGITPKVVRAKVCLRGDLIDTLERLEADYRQALADDDNLGGEAAAKLAERIAEVQAEAEQASVEFVFHAIGQRPWADLIAEHPPTPEGKKNGEQFDPKTFPFAAVAASCVQPTGVTFAGVEKLYEKVNFGQWQALWGACLEANIGTVSVPRSAAASVTRRRSAGS